MDGFRMQWEAALKCGIVYVALRCNSHDDFCDFDLINLDY